MARRNPRPGIKTWGRQRWHRWLDRRIPPAPSITLDRRHLFVFASTLGWWYLASLILVFVAAINFQNGLAMMLVFLMAAVGLLSILMAHHNLSGLCLTGLDVEPIFAGQSGELRVLLTAEKPVCSVSLGTSRKTQVCVDVARGGSRVVSLFEKPQSRGVYAVGRCYVETLYPFGLVRCWSWVDLRQQWVVYPRPVEPPEHASQLAEQQGQEGEPVASDAWGETRRYERGDPLRRVDWRAYARTRKLYTRQDEPEFRGAEVVAWNDYPGVDTERRLSFLCHRLLQAEKAGKDYALSLPEKHMPAGRGEAHLKRCLYALAEFPVRGEA